MTRRAKPGARRFAPKKRAARAKAAADAKPTPLAYMLSLMHDEGLSMTARLNAAKAAAPYMHSRPAAPLGDADAGALAWLRALSRQDDEAADGV